MRRMEVRRMFSRRAISDLLKPARCSFRISAVWMIAVAGRPSHFPFCRAWAKPARTCSRSISRSNQLKVTLRDIHPVIWRRIQVWEDTTLAQLHTILQIVMGWEDCHLHQFAIGRRLYSVPDPDDDMYERKVIDESRVLLGEAVPCVGTPFAYLYDFGDSWEH